MPSNRIDPIQTYPSQVGHPGSIFSPSDGIDVVNAASVNPAFQNLDNGLAYLAALTLGANAAPPNAQPPALNSNSGPARIFTVNGDPSVLATFHASDAGSIANLVGYGYYLWSNARSATADGKYIVNDDATGQWISLHYQFRGTTAAGTLGPADGIAALDGDGQVPGAEIPMVALSWTTGTAYKVNNLVQNGAGKRYAVLTAGGGGISTVEPTAASNPVPVGADGYQWYLINADPTLTGVVPQAVGGVLDAGQLPPIPAPLLPGLSARVWGVVNATTGAIIAGSGNFSTAIEAGANAKNCLAISSTLLSANSFIPSCTYNDGGAGYYITHVDSLVGGSPYKFRFGAYDPTGTPGDTDIGNLGTIYFSVLC